MKRCRYGVLVLLLSMTLQWNTAAASKVLVGYGASDAVISIKSQELFYAGFEIGMQSVLGRQWEREIIVRKFANDKSPLAASRVAHALLNDQVDIMVGFPTSHEALQVAPLAQQRKTVAIFSAASHSKLGQFGKYVYTTGESMQAVVRATMTYIGEKWPGMTGVMIVNPYAVYSYDHLGALKQIEVQPESGLKNMKIERVGRDGALTREAIAFLHRCRHRCFAYVTMYPDESARLMEQLNREGIDIPIMASSSWTTADLDLIRRFLAKRRSGIFSPALWHRGHAETALVLRRIQHVYGRSDAPEVIYGYDLGVVVGHLIHKAESRSGEPSKALFASLMRGACFAGTSAGTLCFPKGGGHALRKIFFVRINKDGYSLDRPSE